MLNIADLWADALNSPNSLSEDHFKALLDDRLWFVTDQLNNVSNVSEKETLFDLIMLAIDSLSEQRQAVLNLTKITQLNQSFICHAQAQILREINIWHEQLNLHWNVGKHLQNVLFFGVLSYAVNIWLDDDTPDASKVMAKIDELITWLLTMKTQPLQIFDKFSFWGYPR